MSNEFVVPGRSCGSCTLCCELMSIPAIEKKPNVMCRHCDGGCTIYETRPKECRAFLCGYLVDDTRDERWKPDQCHFLLSLRRDENRVIVLVDPNYPDAWKQEPYYTALVRLARKGAAHDGKVLVYVRDTEIVLTPRL